MTPHEYFTRWTVLLLTFYLLGGALFLTGLYWVIRAAVTAALHSASD